MAKKNNFVQRIFGSGAGADQIGVFGSLFAGSEATTTDPDTAQSLSNWLTGWFGAAIGGNAPAIEDMNAPFFVTTYRLAYMQEVGVPEWITSATYYIGSFVNVAGVLYVSLVDNNTGHAVSDTAYWKPYSTDITGVGKDYWGVSLPAGYVWAAGRTIGDASSNATERANADTFDLFSILWGYNSTLYPIYTSTGSLSTRGGSAAADFAAHKAITMIDKRERASVGLGTMGGTSDPARMTVAGCGIDPTILGNSGGEETHALTANENGTHTHTQNAHTHVQNAHTHSAQMYYNDTGPSGANFFRGSGNAASGGTPSTASATAVNQNATAVNNDSGLGTGHNNVQPTIVCNYIIKL